MRAIESQVELWLNPATPTDRLKHIERAGRVCYKSEDRMTDASTEKFLNAVLKRGHLSVFEHGNIVLKPTLATYLWLCRAVERNRGKGIPCYLRLSHDKTEYIASGNARAWHDFFSTFSTSDQYLPTELAAFAANNPSLFGDIPTALLTNQDDATLASDCPREVFTLKHDRISTRLMHSTATLHFTVDRGVSHEIVRHRTLSFSQESTRYCNYSKDKFGREITVIKPRYVAEDTLLYPAWYVGCIGAERAYFAMLDAGATAQEARSVLPNSLKTEIVVTGHYNDWREFLRLRTASDAHPDIRKVALDAGRLLCQLDSEIFAEYA